ncbi:alpha/beta hydrolase protein [Haematococcus lacustris]|uniref:Alpha/beta hydrolase protein n=1 Tax=Haematococcus lacustris TaxID=44745 RepID=A0A699ZJ94_HAELA|nr:alpha/beta hydrolase protein [Haematococcus lacustris]
MRGGASAWAVQRLVLISAQGFTEGVPPAPWPLAALGVALLRTVWLRSRANQLAYHDKATWATDDAWRVGRLNTFLPGWFEANVAFIQSGGYFMPEQRIQQVRPEL